MSLLRHRFLPTFVALGWLSWASVPQAAEAWPGSSWQTARPGDVGMDAGRLEDAVEIGSRRGGSGIVVRAGKRVASWGDQKKLYDIKSSTKSIGSVLLGRAIAEGRVTLNTEVKQRLPELAVPTSDTRGRAWLPEIDVRHLATHSAGYDKGGGIEKLLFRPETGWSYSDGGPNWIADLLTVTWGRDLASVLREQVLTTLQISSAQVAWREHAYRSRTLRGIKRREFGSGIRTSVDAMARIGLLLEREGVWRGRRMIPDEFVEQARTTPEWLADLPQRDSSVSGGAPRHYGMLFWNNADGAMPDVPRDAFWSWGLYDSFFLMIPSLDLVAARAGPSLTSGPWGDLDALEPFFTALSRSVPD